MTFLKNDASRNSCGWTMDNIRSVNKILMITIYVDYWWCLLKLFTCNTEKIKRNFIVLLWDMIFDYEIWWIQGWLVWRDRLTLLEPAGTIAKLLQLLRRIMTRIVSKKELEKFPLFSSKICENCEILRRTISFDAIIPTRDWSNKTGSTWRKKDS